MGIFKINAKLEDSKRLEQQIESRVKERVKEHGDFVQKENELAAPVLDYSNREMEDVPYELFRAREYVKMFPEEDFVAPGRFSGMRRLYQRIVRRLLRQQIVFNEFMLGAVEELNQRLVSLEKRIKFLEDVKPKTGGGDDSE